MQPLHPPSFRSPDRLPLQQSPFYGRALRLLGAEVRQVWLQDGGKCWGQALLLRRGWRGLGVTACLRGPLWQGDPSPELRAGLLAGLRRETGLLLIQPEGADTPTQGLPLAGGRDLAILPLRDPVAQRRAFSRSWRNHLCRGETSGLGIESLNPAAEDLDWILAADRRQQHQKGYRALPARFVLAWAAANPGAMRLYRARAGRDVVAAALFLLHRPWASYHVAVSLPAARNMEAHRLILWHAMQELRSEGCDTLDLGVAEVSNPGLAAFKRDTGARLETSGRSVLVLPPRRGRPAFLLGPLRGRPGTGSR